MRYLSPFLFFFFFFLGNLDLPDYVITSTTRTSSFPLLPLPSHRDRIKTGTKILSVDTTKSLLHQIMQISISSTIRIFRKPDDALFIPILWRIISVNRIWIVRFAITIDLNRPNSSHHPRQNYILIYSISEETKWLKNCIRETVTITLELYSE